MNDRVPSALMRCLFGVLLAFYVISWFDPSQFEIVIRSSNLERLGAFVDGNKWAYFAVGGVSRILANYVYFCACRREWWLDRVTFGVICADAALSIWFYEQPELNMVWSTVFMIVSPIMLGCGKLNTVVTYLLILATQSILLETRSTNVGIDYESFSGGIIIYIDFMASRFIFAVYNIKKEGLLWGSAHLSWTQTLQSLRKLSPRSVSRWLTGTAQAISQRLTRTLSRCVRCMRNWLMSLSNPADRILLAANLKQIAQFTVAVGAFAWIADKEVEFIAFAVPFHVMRYSFSHQYHASSTRLCTRLSIALACICIAVTAPIETSLVSMLAVGFFAAWIGDMAARLEKKTPDYYAKFGFGKLLQMFAYDMIDRKLDNTALMVEHEIGYDTMKTRKRRVREKVFPKKTDEPDLNP